MTPSGSRENKLLAALLGLLLLVLGATTVPETFTIDDCNYFATVHALRAGSVFVPHTAELSPSRELVGFDPVARHRRLERGRIAPTTPPLYAPWALPFSYLGWRWLIVLNTLALLATSWLVFQLTKRYATRQHSRWIALALFVLGGFSLDYAQGMWPHMLSVALTTGGVWLSCRARDENRLVLAAGAGLLIGLAAGIRYQNVVFALAVGVTLLVWAERRWHAGAAYALGVGVPLAITAVINRVRLGTFNPISKGFVAYLPSAPTRAARNPLVDVASSAWALIVDYSAHPPFATPNARASLPKEPGTGAFLVIGGIKKALLQSAPWVAIALLAFVLVFTRRSPVADERQKLVRVLAVPVMAVLVLFSWAGLERHDGWSFNQRYLLELVPLFAVTVAVVVDSWELDPAPIAIGGALGMALAAIPIVAAIPEHAFRQRMLMITPVALAGLVVAAWMWRRTTFARTALLAACLGWALVVHVGDDMVAARGRRAFNGFQRTAAATHLPAGPVALIVGSPQKEAMCPLHLDHDLVLVDPYADKGEDLHALTGELLTAGRRVFVTGGLPEPWLAAIFHGRRVRMLSTAPLPFAEVVAAQGGDASLQQRKPVE